MRTVQEWHELFAQRCAGAAQWPEKPHDLLDEIKAYKVSLIRNHTELADAPQKVFIGMYDGKVPLNFLAELNAFTKGDKHLPSKKWTDHVADVARGIQERLQQGLERGVPAPGDISPVAASAPVRFPPAGKTLLKLTAAKRTAAKSTVAKLTSANPTSDSSDEEGEIEEEQEEADSEAPANEPPANQLGDAALMREQEEQEERQLDILFQAERVIIPRVMKTVHPLKIHELELVVKSIQDLISERKRKVVEDAKESIRKRIKAFIEAEARELFSVIDEDPVAFVEGAMKEVFQK